MPGIDVYLCDDPREVERIARRWLAEHAVDANMPATLLARERRRLDAGEEPELAWALALVGDDPVAVAVSGAGRPAVLAGADAATAEALADAWYAVGAAMTGAVGDAEAAAAFARRWEVLSGARARIGLREGLHVLGTFTPATGVPGRARAVDPSDEADLELAARWLQDFYAEALPHLPPISPEAARTRVAQGGYLLWDDGEPVSMAGVRTAVGVGRVGPVWTPPDRRAKGYAAAVASAATRAILDVGAVAVLYTDLSNPTSNGVYRRLGYRMVAETAEWVFDPA